MLNIKVGNLIRFNSDVARTRNLHTVYRVVRVTPQGFFTALRGWLTHNGRGWNSHDSHETAFCPADLRDFHLVAKDIYSLPPEPEPLTGSYDVHKTPSRPKFACYEEELAFLLKDAGPLSGIPTRHAYNRNDCYDLEVGAVVKLRSGPLCEYRGEKNPEGAYIVHLLDGGSDRLLWGSPDVCSVVYLPSRDGSPNALSAREEALAKLCKDAPVLPCDTKGEWGDCCLVLQPGDVVRNLEGTLHEYRGQKGSGDTYVLHCLSPGRGFARADTWYGSSHVFKLVHRRAPRRAATQPTEVKPEVKPEVATTPAPAPSVATSTGAGGNIAFDLGQATAPKRPVTASILTHSGQLLDVLNPDPKAIKIEDIAHALSQKVRWGGHSARPITIAEHSVRVARVARYLCNERGFDKDAALRAELAALLHDAAEAYIGDMPKPIKDALPVWDSQIEKPLQDAILKAFDCEMITSFRVNVVKLADQLVNQIELETHMTGFWSLTQEQRAAASAYTGDWQLLQRIAGDWQLLQRIAGDQSIFGYDFTRNSPESVWESNFMHRFNELTEALAK